MQIIKNDNPLWTERHIQFTERHAENFGIFFSSVQIEQEIRNINNNNATRRCGEDILCYEIFND